MDIKETAEKFGFSVTRERPSKELGGTVYEMEHKETGAALCWLDNGASNKLFAAGFRTIPEDHTGVFHILEHSVLCGSDKFPLKEPFVDLLKSSMQTYLNAMTFPDKTVYPVASRNSQDFLNLTEVYLDAVFAPLIRKDPKAFLQEGWHIEFDEEGSPSYKGVVFNEMKGAFTDVDSVIELALHGVLFPDNSYRFESGGYPERIPDLTYEAYLAAWKKFYHPSNCCFYLDGSVPIGETLELISGYLSGKSRLSQLPEDKLQSPVSGQAQVVYEIGEDESEKDRTHFSMAKIIAPFGDKASELAADVLAEYLTGSNSAPLKKAVIDRGLGQDVDCEAVLGIAQPYFLLSVRNTDSHKLEELKEVIGSTVREILEKGLDPEELEACIDRQEFQLRDMREPQGLTRCIWALDGYFYRRDPMIWLEHGPALKKLREMAKNGGFEELLERLMSPEGMCCVTAVPDKEEGRRRQAAEAAALAERVAKMTDEQRSSARETAKALTAWQAAPDSEEARASVPVLSPDQISPDPEPVLTLADSIGGTRVLRHSVPTGGIVHFSLYFDVSELSLSELSQLSLIEDLLGQLPTKRHTAAELQRLIRRNTGSLEFSVTAHSKIGDRETCRPSVTVRCSALEEKAPQAAELICEILTETDFSHTQQIGKILLQAEENDRQTVITEGHRIGMRAALARYSAKNAAIEAISGFSRAETVHALVKAKDAGCEGLGRLIGEALGRCACTRRLTLSVTSDTQPDILSMLSLPEGEAPGGPALYRAELPERLGISIPASVSYAVQGWQTEERTGALLVAGKILTLDHLWNRVRVQGGAYGAGLVADSAGGLICYSYRDPSPARSLETYKGLGQAVREWCAGGEDLGRYMISTVADTEPLRSPGKLGIYEDEAWLSGIGQEQRRKLRREILSVTKEELLGLCDTLSQLGEKGSVCVAGGPEAVRSCPELTVKSI
ncbi:MAG: insulinase family protein [Ruminococcus sp.]|nr:insulinase family protein [Ruminococcus sp.]